MVNLEMKIKVETIHPQMKDPPKGYRFVGMAIQDDKPIDLYRSDRGGTNQYWARYMLMD